MGGCWSVNNRRECGVVEWNGLEMSFRVLSEKAAVLRAVECWRREGVAEFVAHAGKNLLAIVEMVR
jgi:hypothetical protein